MNSIKPFYEVFPGLKLGGETGALFGETGVSRIRTSSDHRIVEIYLQSPNIIPDKEIKKTQSSIEKLLGRYGSRVRINVRFKLSAQYNVNTLLEAYSESMEEELKRLSPLTYNIYRHTEIDTSEEGSIVLTLPDNLVAHREEQNLTDYFDEVLNNRCALKVIIKVRYEKKAAEPERAMEEENIRQTLIQLAHGSSYEEDTAGQGAGAEEGMNAAQEPPGENAGKDSSKKQDKGEPGDEKPKGSSFINSKDPDVIYGRDVKDETKPISSVIGDMEESVCVRGRLFGYSEKEIAQGTKFIITLYLTDMTDSVALKVFINAEDHDEFYSLIGGKDLEKGKPTLFVKVKGIYMADRFERENTVQKIYGIKKIPEFTIERRDEARVKRVELHCHSKMSEYDGVSSVSDIIKKASGWGMKALAITDHGTVQAFPIAAHSLPDDPEFKMIYGVEGYLVDDLKKAVLNMPDRDTGREHPLSGSFVVFDIETTGFSADNDKIIEIGAVKVEGGRIADRFSTFVNPERPIPFRIKNLTHISDEMVEDAPVIADVLPKFLEFVGDSGVVAHNAAFDTGFIRKNARDIKEEFDLLILDTVSLARIVLPNLKNYKLDTVVEALNVTLDNHHRAVDDAEATAECFIRLCELLEAKKVRTIEELMTIDTMPPNMIKKLPTYHIILLAKNETGRINLYKLVSLSYINYFARRPRIPKSELMKYREGLIVGSACSAGELFSELLRGASDAELSRIAGFYDYLEIQPLGNNGYLTRNENNYSEEDLKNFNRKIVELGDRLGKPVCATGDVHFLEPKDAIYRRIIMTGREFDDADEQGPLYLHTTEEMLEEFKYLGEEKAQEVVINNTNLIASMIDRISPVRPDKCPPVIENSDKILRDICYSRAHEIYGETLPRQVEERTEKELNSIIQNGYAVLYVIAQKLVWKSNEDNYLVGSRGSVGSSFVAYLAGITEVNSLSSHYICPNCHYYDFDSEEVREYSNKGMCGADMPDKVCPNCGRPLVKDGFDIPFETFLGFKGDKEPDIDLNFSGDYQSKAHKYTEVIFGAGQTFRAGTVGTLADKTAIGYVNNFYDKHQDDILNGKYNDDPEALMRRQESLGKSDAVIYGHYGTSERRAEKLRLASGCVGIARTTGQHPGGIVVLPHGEEIYTFTPVQRPANDMKVNIVTTQFEYHSIDHNLLKLDILGHDDPTMIRFLQDATGVQLSDIKFDDPVVMKLFTSPEPLGIKSEDIRGIKTGTLGIPEYGTNFVIQMLVDTKPQYFSDLIRISGLSHGTDVWTGNAQELVNNMNKTLSDCICCRDDIMIYLIAKGMDPALSFSTMESVRKGKGLKPEMKEAMIEVGVPDWYIDSCLKIKYMFPKAHAAAYVMMAWRVAWFKINRPLAYYSGFFSIRAGIIDYATMCTGADTLTETLDKLLDKEKQLKKERKNLSATEKDQIRDMRLIEEMYARGFEFAPIDLKVVDAKYFKQVDDKRIMPSLKTVEGMGESQADVLVNAIRATLDAGDFVSVEDFKTRTGCSANQALRLKSLGLLGDIPDSAQMSIFDFL
ncbi:MAG: PolC-type DNA polymerase III [Lachnospiraceae bacterium]|nr:PolC-type DNA polymerase III [Lachnospiraceae bacterium]